MLAIMRMEKKMVSSSMQKDLRETEVAQLPDDDDNDDDDPQLNECPKSNFYYRL